MRVGRVVRVAGALVVDQRVGGDPGRDEEGRHTANPLIKNTHMDSFVSHGGCLPNTKPGKVVGHVVTVRYAAERDVVVGGRNVRRWRHVVSESTVFVEVENNQTKKVSDSSGNEVMGGALRIVPVLGVADRIVHMLDQQLSGGQVAQRVHRRDIAALWVVVRELRQRALLQVAVELVGVDDVVHCIVLDPLVHERVDDIRLIVLRVRNQQGLPYGPVYVTYVLPGDVLLAEGLENGRGTADTRHIVEPTRCLVGVVHKTTGRSSRRELAVSVGRTRVFGKLFRPQVSLPLDAKSS